MDSSTYERLRYQPCPLMSGQHHQLKPLLLQPLTTHRHLRRPQMPPVQLPTQATRRRSRATTPTTTTAFTTTAATMETTVTTPGEAATTTTAMVAMPTTTPMEIPECSSRATKTRRATPLVWGVRVITLRALGRHSLHRLPLEAITLETWDLEDIKEEWENLEHRDLVAVHPLHPTTMPRWEEDRKWM